MDYVGSNIWCALLDSDSVSTRHKEPAASHSENTACMYRGGLAVGCMNTKCALQWDSDERSNQNKQITQFPLPLVQKNIRGGE